MNNPEGAYVGLVKRGLFKIITLFQVGHMSLRRQRLPVLSLALWSALKLVLSNSLFKK